MSNLFEHPEVEAVFNDLYERIFHETGRGALLIATSFVDEHLTKLIVTIILPYKNPNKLLKYPGALSSFSAKIELSYAFRLIGENLYNRLNALRKIRNEAAHSPASFKLSDLKTRMTEVYDMGPAMPVHIQNLAVEMMAKSKIRGLVDLFDERNYTQEQRDTEIERISKDKELMAVMDEQVPHWELLVGISLLCGFICFIKEDLAKHIKSRDTWGGVEKPNYNESTRSQL